MCSLSSINCIKGLGSQLSTGEEFSLTDNRLLCKQHYLELIHGQCKAKTKRVRTTFAEEQLSVLQAHFQIDSNPDGADLEKIANITGLSKRVTQVWFQNSRARQKKYQGSKKSRASGGGNDRSGSATNNSGRSSTTTMESIPGSPGCDDGMMFPTSVTTSADDIDKPMDSMMFSE
uniref:Homeobox domain-containing protein n=1 Tax=Panagrolaimus superbus TaxID=310955 RepID=A0A914XWG4_9BILA